MRARLFESILACVLGLCATQVSAITNVISGDITNNVTWSGTNLVQGTVIIRSNAVVTVDPGTTMLMSNSATIRIEGQLLANGTTAQPIRFTRHASGARWGRLLFVRAADSRLTHCVIEYSDCVGDHKDFYDTDCNDATPYPSRTYFQAVVAVACHLDIEDCTFQNLPDGGASAEGDAIAIISDDPDLPGDASANIRGCQFLSIGQGVHTRYAYVLVEGCFFTNHHGDNDDVDLYGESTPPPLILNNMFLNPAHDDMINPTRCSAIIIGNIIAGGDDHGIVLRDKCEPILINNLIYNCSSAGIAVQNQCDALILNNTIVNCGRGIRFFDHTGRWGPPYCLFPGSGKATVINCIIWDCPTSFELADSPYTGDLGSHATVVRCDVEGGQGTTSVSANSTLAWVDNINVNPQFVNLAGDDYHLTAASPCIDAGTNVNAVVTNSMVSVTNDYDGVPRPLDGNGDGFAANDIGAYEFLLTTADSNGDGIPDGWTWEHGLNPAEPSVANEDPDMDGTTTGEEWVADTDPTNALSFFRIQGISALSPLTIQFQSSSNRQYTLLCSTNLTGSNTLSAVASQVDIPGSGGVDTLSDTNAAGTQKFYRIEVSVPAGGGNR